MRATEIAAVFEQIAPPSIGCASDIDNEYLGFRFGDREIDVTGVGVAWWMSQEVIEAAIEKGLNFLICHEPELFRFYKSPFHSNMLPETVPFNLRKMKMLLDHGITVYTAHSNWDLQTEVGMGPTVARALGMTALEKTDVCMGVYTLEGMTFGALVRQVKERLGLDHVRVQGADEMPVRRVVVGFGSVGSEVEAIIVNRCDAGIFGELREWPFLFARESGVGIIEMTHLVSESIGFRSVVDELSRRIPDLRVEFLEVPCAYRLA